MVDSISRKNPSLVPDAAAAGVQTTQDIARLNQQAAEVAITDKTVDYLDNASLSEEAKRAFESEREILKYARLAMRVQDTPDGDKVAQLKNLVDSGRIQEYLSSINPGELVDAMLSAPVAGYLKQG
ncbi:MAG: hypothetical protein AB7P76_06560 [Candidatus Melainabacteria bacterium]